MKTARATVVGLLLFMVALPIHAGVITAELESMLQSAAPDERIPVIVTLSDRVNVKHFKEGSKRIRRANIIRALKQRFEDNMNRSSLKTLVQGIGQTGRLRPLWIINGVALNARPNLIRRIAAKPWVESVRKDEVIEMPILELAYDAEPEWNLTAIRAQEFWGMGYTGQGVVVASMDTGVDANHADLAGRWRGGSNSWYDPYGEHAEPYDKDGHGTAVMSIIVGGDAGGTAIGVAPGAKWIGVKIWDDAGNSLESAVHSGFQWLLDPDGNPDTDDAPDVVNNSWGFIQAPDECVEEQGGISFRTDIQVLKQAGIAIVFSAGNNGPFPYTSVSPANYPESFAVGSVDEYGTVSDFSSRGPSACDGAIFPDVVAPGDRLTNPFGVKTADLTFGGLFPNSYAYLTGTSMAAPHAAGAMALLLSASQELTPELLESALKNSALDLGMPGQDNEYGYGLIDVVEAYLLDNVVITNVAYSSRRNQLLVEATSSSQPDVILSAEGFGNLLWDSEKTLYRRVFPAPVEPASVTVTSTGGGTATYSLPAADTVSITNVAWSFNKSQLLVEATSSAQPDVSLSAEGYGNLLWDSGRSLYRRVFGNVAASPASFTVHSTGGGSATFTAPAAETVTITSVVYSARNTQLLVEAVSSSQPDVSLSSEGYGNLLWDSGRSLYRRVFGNVAVSPASITVKSSAGGSDIWNLEGTTTIVVASTTISTTTTTSTTTATVVED